MVDVLLAGFHAGLTPWPAGWLSMTVEQRQAAAAAFAERAKSAIDPQFLKFRLANPQMFPPPPVAKPVATVAPYSSPSVGTYGQPVASLAANPTANPAASPAPLKLAFLSSGFSIGGAERWILSLMRNFDPTTIKTVALQISNPHSISPIMLDQVARSVDVRIGIDKRDVVATIEPADVLLAWGSTHLIQAAKGCGKPLIVCLHGAFTEPSEYGSEIAETAVAAGAILAAVNPACLGCFPPAVRDRVTIIPNGVDLDRIAPRRGRQPGRESLDVRPDQKLLLYFGRVMGDKDIQGIAAATGKLPPEWTCRLVGPPDPDSQRPESLAKLQSLAGGAGRLKHFPPVNHVGDLLAAADAMILLSPSEAHPLSVTEAWLAGVPTVVSDLPWIRAMHAEHGELATLVPRDATPAEAAAKIISASVDAIRTAETQEIARENFTAAKMAAKWEELIGST